MYRALASAVLVGCCALALAGSAWPQDTSLLDQAERLADRGENREARQALLRWQSDFAESAPLEQQARAWFLTGRLAEDGEEAELQYLKVVIEGSTTPYADDALLRLAQYKYAREEYAKVVEYLSRLRRDYPTSEHGPEALLWVSRAARAMGDTQRACAAVEQGLLELAPGDSLLDRALREERMACGASEQSYTVQVAAFRDEAAAQSLARELLIAGYDAWVLAATPDDPIYRVRVGRGLLEAEAQGLLERLVGEGHSPFLVSQEERIER
ncbi:MAG: SPOR domain-containing protein [Gemmatimonadota bacterium]|nr:MAG: SPOR domain-containing protein [Gemmatimonadota bacterium]